MTMHIDAHQHFWQPLRGDYDWMPADNPVLSRPYAPADLWPQMQAAGVTGTILVQAAATVHETEYMLGLADATPWVLGVVGWVDFENPGDLAHLKRLARHPKFKGVRPMIQDIADDDWMLRGDVQWAFGALSDLGLTFDALGFPRHLPNFLTILTRYPDLRVVVDHCMKPQIRLKSQDHFTLWADGMARIADHTRACCKFSALITEDDANWSVDSLRPYSDHVLSAFGPDRVMWGSDWPVCRLRGEYADWRAAALTLTESLTLAERAQVFGGTAARFYGV
jgi:L-fuconolactonase